jgi:hypothetical protein
MNKTNSSSGGIGFFGLLQVLFIGLKLTGNVDWSWWWVLSPIWIPFSLIIVVALFFAWMEM